MLTEGSLAATATASPGRRLTDVFVVLRRPIFTGLIGGAALVAVYITIVQVGSRSWTHTRDLLLADRFYVAGVAAGFGIEMGLYRYVRGLLRGGQGLRSATAVAATGTGTSTASMVACCLHHVSDVLPVVGASGAAVFLSNYKVPVIIVGLVTNALGIGLMVRTIVHHNRVVARVTGTASAVNSSATGPEAAAAHCHTP